MRALSSDSWSSILLTDELDLLVEENRMLRHEVVELLLQREELREAQARRLLDGRHLSS
jgi:hypothetical protein